MDLIVAAPDGMASSMEVINAAPELEKAMRIKMSMTHAENLVKRLIKDKWMSEVSQYFLAVFRVKSNYIIIIPFTLLGTQGKVSNFLNFFLF